MPGVPERGYQASEQVGSTAPLPMASEAAYGAGVGAAIAQAGGMLHEDQVRAMRLEKERRQQAEISAKGAEFARTVGDYKVAVKDLEDNSEPDGTGHVDNVRNLGQVRFDQFLGSISDPRVREHFAALAAGVQSDAVDGADSFARGARLKDIGQTQVKATGEWAGQVMLHPEPDGLKDAIAERTSTIAALQAPPHQKQQWLDQSLDTIEYAYGQGLTRSDPQGARAVFESGLLTHLTPEHRLALLNANGTDIRIAEADARRVQSQALTQLHEDVKEYTQSVDRGELPKDEVPAALVSRAKALGDAGVIDDLQYTQGKAKLSRLTDKWTSVEWEGHVNALAAKVAGGKASADEQQELRALQELRPAKEARFKGDPEGFASASGIPAPQVDLADPAAGSVNARKAWARAFARTGGLVEPPYLSKDQLQVYRDRANQGPVGQLEVAQELKSTWGADAAPSIVRQIGGEPKADMQIMLGLNPRMAQVYGRGAEALSKKTVKFNDDAARGVWADYANAVPPDVRPALFNAARNIAAGWMSEQGKTEPTADFAEVFRQAVHRAAGMLGSAGEGSATGGFVKWNGRYTWLPPEMARTDFQQRVSRSAPQDWIRAAVDAAGNPVSAAPHHLGTDGKPKPYTLGEAQRFGSGTLQTVAPGIYRLIDPSGAAVVDQHGQPWQFDIRKLSPGFDAALAAHGYVRR